MESSQNGKSQIKYTWDLGRGGFETIYGCRKPWVK
jgi:hypothetical protein